MKSMKGRMGEGSKKNIKIVLPQEHSIKCNTKDNDNSNCPQSGINVELSVSMDLNKLISGIDGYVWATWDSLQAEIICNALRVQNVDLEIVKIEIENKVMYLIKITKEEDVMNVIDFIHNEKSGLRLKPDWTYPEGEPNESFNQWINQ
jgi:hypothetical protein